jgi:hypothetical protein
MYFALVPSGSTSTMDAQGSRLAFLSGAAGSSSGWCCSVAAAGSAGISSVFSAVLRLVIGASMLVGLPV